MSSKSENRAIDAAAALGAWAVACWYLLLSGRWSDHLAARMFWIVPVAAIALTIAAVAQVLRASTRRARRRWIAMLIALPAAMIVVVPLEPLSNFAAERRTSFTVAGSAAVPDGSTGITLQQLGSAVHSEPVAQALRKRQGETVELLGMAMKPEPAHGFVLTRFVVACCVVDATVVEVRVRTAATLPQENAWVAVEGRVEVDDDGGLYVDAAHVARVARPDPPYLYPGS